MSVDDPVAGVDLVRVEEAESTIPQRVRAIAGSAPQRVAIRVGPVELTYEELVDAAAGVAAGVLDAAGAVPHPVGVLTGQPVAGAAAAMGVTATGRPFVPLDLDLPPPLLRARLDHAGADLVLTDRPPRAVRDRLGGIAALDVASLTDPAAPRDHDDRATPDRPSWLGYTSGTTGTPKAVVRTHRCDLYTYGFGPWARIGPEDRAGVIYAGAFTGAMGNPLRGLLPGATAEAYDLRSGGLLGLARWLQDAEVTVLTIVPTVLRQLLDVIDAGVRFPRLRLVILTGEVVRAGDVQRLRPRLGERGEVRNRLMATEVGAIASLVVVADDEPPGGLVPAGYPPPGTEVLLLDEAGLPVSEGQIGRLTVRSRYTAAGYWRDPEATARTFQAAHDDPEATLVRLGDLAYRDDRGALVHVGRDDDVVKVRGNRVALREVEAAVAGTAGVRDAVVTRAIGDGAVRLVAYAIPEPGTSAEDIRRALNERLPSHAVPGHIELIASFPRLRSGKVDRSGLPAPTAPDVSSVRPSDPTEVRLERLMARVLHLPRVGTDDDFFDLGGDSMQAARLFADIERSFGVDLPLATIVAAPTVRELAVRVRAGGQASDWGHLITVRVGGIRPPLFCIHGRQGNVLWARRLAERLPTEQPIYGLQSEGLDGRPVTETTITGIARRHLAAIREVQPTGPYLLFGYSFGGVVAYEIANQLAREGHDVPLLVLGDTFCPTWRVLPDMSVGQRVRIHRDNLAGMRGRRWRRYGRRILRNARVRTVRRVASTLVNWMTLPRRLRGTYIGLVHDRAGRAYVVPEYTGRVVLFRTDLFRHLPDRGWTGHITGPFEILDVPGGHEDFIREPGLTPFAERLDEVLVSALTDRVSPSATG